MDPLKPEQTGPAVVSLALRHADLDEMRRHVASHADEEACGLLAGTRDGERCFVNQVIPVANALHSPVRYRMDPHEQLAAFNRIDESGLELVGIYHSHPNGPPGPSATDLAEAYYPEAAYLIWSRSGETWLCRAFGLRSGQFAPVALEIEPDV